MANPGLFEPKSLQAADTQDLQLISAMLQDAVAKIGDMAWLPRARRFAFVANRFVWEVANKNTLIKPNLRVRVGVHIDDVVQVQSQHLRLDAKDAVVDVLALRFVAGDDGAGALFLDLAGGGGVKLGVECLNVTMNDLSAPWAARGVPDHGDD